MNSIVPFDFEGLAVRVLDRGGEPWFVLADVCKVLAIGNPSDAARRLEDGEKSTLSPIEGKDFTGAHLRGALPTIINESGLYSLIMTSRKPEARRFQNWVTGTVLPSIRKHGGYVMGQESLEPMELLARAMLVANRVIAERNAKIATLAPMAAVAVD